MHESLSHLRHITIIEKAKLSVSKPSVIADQIVVRVLAAVDADRRECLSRALQFSGL